MFVKDDQVDDGYSGRVGRLMDLRVHHEAAMEKLLNTNRESLETSELATNILELH